MIKTPITDGWYWVWQWHKWRMVKVWHYAPGSPISEKELFTNEDGGAPVNDEEMYADALWYGPLEIPPHPTQEDIHGGK